MAMSVAIEFAPDFDELDGGVPGLRARPALRAVPDLPLRPGLAPAPSRRAGSGAGSGRGAAVRVLRAPSDVSPGLRLTRRGAVVLSVAAAVFGLALVWLAALSGSADPAPAHAGPAVVTVAPGDTLWTIAGRAAPDTDPRVEVDRLVSLNHLSDVDLVPGQQLHVR